MNYQKFLYFAVNNVYNTEDRGEIILDMDGDAISNNCGVSMFEAARWSYENGGGCYGRDHADGTSEGVTWIGNVE